MDLVYRIETPPDVAPPVRLTTVVLIHGWKGNEEVMSIFRHAVPEGRIIVRPRAPFPVVDGGYGWIRAKRTAAAATSSEALTEGAEALQRLLRTLPEQHPVDPERLILVGFSQGAAVANLLIQSGRGSAAGVASIAGFTPRDTPTPPDLRLENLPVWVAHGRADEVVPLTAAHKTGDRYRNLGARVTQAEYDTGHKLPLQGMRDLRAWLADANPD